MEVTPAGGTLEQLAREHAALRRVATLVASEPPPDEVFTAVAREAGMLLGAQRGTLLRVVNPQWAEVVASWSDGMAPALPVGHCAAIEEGRGLLGQMLHPTVLTKHGLEAALTALAQRAPLPVDLSVAVPDRLDPTIEAAAYFLVSEALTNVAKHAQADRVSVDIATSDGTLKVTIADDGAGGADVAKGSGLRGLVDRVTAVGGQLDVSSPPGRGTRLSARLPANVLATLHTQPPKVT